MWVPGYLIKSACSALIAWTSMSSDVEPAEKQFLQKYFVAQKELPRYIEALLGSHLPLDVLNVILSKYLLVVNATRQELCDSLISRYITPERCKVDKHLMFGSQNGIEPIGDKKYYIEKDADESIILWNAQTKEQEYMGYQYKAPFIYLKKYNKLLCFRKDIDNFDAFVLYDIATKSETIIKRLCRANAYWGNHLLSVDNEENYCALGCNGTTTIVDLNALEKQEDIVPVCRNFLFNNTGDLFIALSGGYNGYNDAKLQVFSLKNDSWEQVITNFVLPFPPQSIRFMKNNYLLVCQSGRHDANGFLHVQICNDENTYSIKTIDDSAGIGCVVRDANQDFFTVWKDYKHLRLIAYDGSLVADVDKFFEFRSQFSSDGRYYVATSSGKYDISRSIFTKKPELLLLSLHSREKKAHIIERSDLATSLFPTHTAFHSSKPFFITYDATRCILHNMRGKALYSWDIPQADYDCKFASHNFGVMIRALQECHTFEPEEGKKLPSENDIGFPEYFLLKNIIADEACKQKLIQYSGERYKNLLQ